jgi:membrane protease YdiL (CAAX protease family)
MSVNESISQEERKTSVALLILTWLPIVIICIPQIVYRQFVQLVPRVPIKPIWMAIVEIVILGVIYLVSWVWKTAKPLRGYFAALLAYSVGTSLLRPLVIYTDFWTNWQQKVPWGIWQVIDRIATHLFPVVLMALSLIGSGIGKQELFLVRGNPGAPCRPSPLLFTKKTEPWPRFVRNFLLVFCIILVTTLIFQLRPDSGQLVQALIYSPAIILTSLINAFGEEFRFRWVLLARTLPILGEKQAIAITSLFFGLAHYFGNPGGILGVLLSAYVGYIVAKSIVETRGSVWAMLIHFLGDFIIYGATATLV